MAVAQARLVQPIDQVADALRHRAHEQNGVGRRELFLQFHPF
jgi:hypothetical protein